MWQVTAKRADTLDSTKSECADYAVQALGGNPSEKTSPQATRHVNTLPQSSQLAEPLWTGPDLICGARELISA